MQFALRSITNKSVHTRFRPWVFRCTALHYWLVLHVVSIAERNTQCTDGEFSSTVNAALKKNFAGISSFTPQQFEALNSLFLRSKDTLINLPAGHNLSAAPDIA